MLDREAYWKLTSYLEKSADEQHLRDVVDEVVSELFNSRYTDDTQRVKGIIEAIEFVTNIKISK